MSRLTGSDFLLGAKYQTEVVLPGVIVLRHHEVERFLQENGLALPNCDGLKAGVCVSESDGKVCRTPDPV